MNIKRYMSVAKEMSKLSTFHRQHVGCIAVYRKCIISTGVNSNKTHPLQKKLNNIRFPEDYSPHTLHAEISTLLPISNLDIDWSKVSLFIYRGRKRCSTPYGLARPCPSCMAYIKSLGIKDVYYTSNDGFIHEVLDV